MTTQLQHSQNIINSYKEANQKNFAPQDSQDDVHFEAVADLLRQIEDKPLKLPQDPTKSFRFCATIGSRINYSSYYTSFYGLLHDNMLDKVWRGKLDLIIEDQHAPQRVEQNPYQISTIQILNGHPSIARPGRTPANLILKNKSELRTAMQLSWSSHLDLFTNHEQEIVKQNPGVWPNQEARPLCTRISYDHTNMSRTLYDPDNKILMVIPFESLTMISTEDPMYYKRLAQMVEINQANQLLNANTYNNDYEI